MAFVPSYMGDTNMYTTKGVSFIGAPVPVKELSRKHQLDNLNELYEFCSQPISTKSNVIWDISLLIKSQDKITRLSSSNHQIDV